MKKLILILGSTAILSAQAQEINKEITIEKEIVPELRAATRLNVGPAIVQPEITHSGLQLADRDLTVGIPPYMIRLDAARTLPAIEISPYRGYVKAGYFPAYSIGISAGYQVVNDSKNRFGIYGQFNGSKYKHNYNDNSDRSRLTDNTGGIGADFTHYFNKYQQLNIGFGLLLSKTELENTDNMGPATFYDGHKTTFDNTALGLRFNAKWISGTKEENYYAGLTADYHSNDPGNITHGGSEDFGNFPPISYNYKGIAQGIYGIDFGIGYHGFSIDASAKLNNVNHFNVIGDLFEDDCVIIEGKSRTAAAITAIPAYTFRNKKAVARIGVRFDYLSSMGKSLTVAPDVSAAITPSDFFSARLNISGGSELNSAGTLYLFNKYMNPCLAYNASNIPMKGQLGLIFGPFKGASIELEAGYAIANDWLMPTFGAAGLNIYTPVDMKGFKGGVRINYDYDGIITATAGIAFSTNGQSRGWFEWRDRAKQVIDIDITAHPISRLSINAGWELRSGRAQTMILSSTEYGLGKIGDFSNLHIGCSYKFTDRLSVFLNGTNILNAKNQLLYSIPCRGISGMAGLSYLF